MVENNSTTPFFLYDRNILQKNVSRYTSRNFHLNYSVKSCSHPLVLQEIEPFVDGFTVTSVKDLNNARALSKKKIHYVSPMIRAQEIESINLEGDSVSFNSLESFERLKMNLEEHIRIFIRVNPELSFLDDDRYDPCRSHSKLGVSLQDFVHYIDVNPSNRIDGIHFHTNCQSGVPSELEWTIAHVEKLLGNRLDKFEEVNMGGGYIYRNGLMDAVNGTQEQWHQRYGVSLRMEPSFDITNSAGFLCSSVVDIFSRQGKNIAVLDTALNHLPEVFEYGDPPEIFTPQMEEGGHSYILAGATCLAGDVFGEYSFARPLRPGERIIFKNVGAYSLVRANTFNGIPIPEVYVDCMDVFVHASTIGNSDALMDGLNA